MSQTADTAWMLDYASGALSEPFALAMATHVALNSEAAQQYEKLNALGGALLDDMEEEYLDGALNDILNRLDDIEPAPATVQSETNIPAPLRAYIGTSYDDLNWRPIGPGIKQALIETGVATHKVGLLKIAPGRPVGQHTHKGIEFTVVLDGAYDDGDMRFEKGDLQLADSSLDHQPLADKDRGCLCLFVLDAPLKFTGPLSKWLNPFITF
ncbi:MAG: ChrR family anti-sigma-E factor [Sphingomonadales bacterium]|jgi:putative transcriptional regulator